MAGTRRERGPHLQCVSPANHTTTLVCEPRVAEHRADQPAGMGVAAAERLCLAILTLPAEAVHRLLVELTIRPPCPSPDPREVLGSRQPAKVLSPPHPTLPAPHGAVRQQLPWECYLTLLALCSCHTMTPGAHQML